MQEGVYARMRAERIMQEGVYARMRRAQRDANDQAHLPLWGKAEGRSGMAVR